MTNLEYIRQMDEDEATDWLVHQLWPELDPHKDTMSYANRWHAIRNFLLDEHVEQEND